MDTLVLEGKEFISTKRAAEITGYAKDYIGQLCREGRVASRLIGRNWYILESSIREHRYGSEVTEEAAESSDSNTATENDFNEIEEKVSFENEPAAENIVEETVSASVAEEPQEDSEAIEEIRRAWQSWFSNRYVEETPATLELSKEREVMATKEAVESAYIEKQTETHESREEQAAPIRISRLSERATVHQSLPSPETLVSMRRGHRAVPLQEAHRGVQEHLEVSRSDRSSQPRKRVILGAFFIAIALISFTIAVIGAGALDSIPVKNTLQSKAMKYIGGTISF